MGINSQKAVRSLLAAFLLWMEAARGLSGPDSAPPDACEACMESHGKETIAGSLECHCSCSSCGRGAKTGDWQRFPMARACKKCARSLAVCALCRNPLGKDSKWASNPLIHESSAEKLKQASKASAEQEGFLYGILVDNETSRKALEEAGLDAEKALGPGRVCFFVVLKENTNRLGFLKWSSDEKTEGSSTLQFRWDRIEPFYRNLFPALFISVPEAAGPRKTRFEYLANNGHAHELRPIEITKVPSSLR